MSALGQEEQDGRLSGLSRPVQWGLLLVVSAALAYGFELVEIPAALLIGPMLGGILVSTNGGTVRMPKLPFYGAQAVVGCLIANSIDPDILVTFAQRWPLFLGVVTLVIAASSTMGWMLSRWQVLPGTTAVWGSSPGGATAMMLMAGAFGADQRLVAFMQYLRVLFVALAASIIARIWIGTSGTITPEIVWFPPLDPVGLAETLAALVLAVLIGRYSRIPAGPLLIPLALGTFLHVAGVVTFALPEWLLAASYAVVGWNIGLGFTRTIIVYALRALPKIVGAILVLIAFCGAIAVVLVEALGIDPLTAYLATSPGGMDSVAIIAASTHVDLPFVMALQTARFMLVLIVGPPIARFLARHIGASDG